ncbi:glucose 1-dehydrogenase [Dactylosporangium fulvum]|uniref:SDR family oxidoreductase n=1 Tax=Dactylosporangium fulvum TaxID=53359 RepID=A0ABY5VT52_9ACTN|nr:SDR family oxidoreductase [Dactylosporangium fulvum]UWP80382.1 SDR family oxidoreductase [Dactylosporangium fulvum]
MRSSGRLEAKVSIVTGAARGIGAATARLFVAEGASVVIADVLRDEGVALAEELGPAAAYTDLDVTQPAAWERAVRFCTDAFGPPDILVANAGVNCPKLIADLTADDLTRVFQVNVIGAFLGIKTVAPVMQHKGGGSIVVMSSAASDTGIAAHAAYGTSKAANASLARNAAVEYAGTGIRINSIHPGGVDTDMSRSPEFEAIDKDAWYGGLPIPRIGLAEEVAQAALFLASDASSYTTGSRVIVDGGQLAGPVAVL